MLYNILAVGDVVGGCGVSHLERHLRAVKKHIFPGLHCCLRKPIGKFIAI